MTRRVKSLLVAVGCAFALGFTIDSPVWSVLLEHPVPVAVGLIGLTCYAWHRLALAIVPEEAPRQPVDEQVIFDVMQRAKLRGVTRVDFVAKRKVG